MSVSETVPEGSVANDTDWMAVRPRALLRASLVSRGEELAEFLLLLMMRQRARMVRGGLEGLGVGPGVGGAGLRVVLGAFLFGRVFRATLAQVGLGGGGAGGGGGGGMGDVSFCSGTGASGTGGVGVGTESTSIESTGEGV